MRLRFLEGIARGRGTEINEPRLIKSFYAPSACNGSVCARNGGFFVFVKLTFVAWAVGREEDKGKLWMQAGASSVP